MYLVKSPWFLKRIYSSCIWEIPVEEGEQILYLTFDDGPHPEITPWVLECLAKYDARASFFCIGKNVLAYPEVYSRILNEGHRVGNHTQHHLNGWKVTDEKYLKDIKEAEKHIDSNLFRPPYGRASRFQMRQIREKMGYEIVMWSVLSGDFDTNITPEVCAQNVIMNAVSGSIIVFHDSEKAFPRMREALERTLSHFAEKGFRFLVLPS